MALKANINDREFDKFEDLGGLTFHRVATNSRILKKKTDTINSLLYYVGEAVDPTALASEAKWRIYRVSTLSGIESVDMADDEDTFTKVWDDRYSYFSVNPFNNPFSVNFLNSNDYVNIGNVSELDFGNANPFSISSWSKNSVTTERVIFSKQGAGTASGYRYYLQSNSMGLLLSGGTGAADRIEIRSANESINNGLWHHCVVTYDGSGSSAGVRFYHDGVLSLVGSYTTVANALVGTLSNVTAAQISGRNGTTNNFQGNINNIAVWNRVLTGSEITEVYNLGMPGDLDSHSAVANLVGWWVCYDEADVTLFPQFTDRSASANDGTGINMSLTQINIDVPT